MTRSPCIANSTSLIAARVGPMSNLRTRPAPQTSTVSCPSMSRMCNSRSAPSRSSNVPTETSPGDWSRLRPCTRCAEARTARSRVSCSRSNAPTGRPFARARSSRRATSRTAVSSARKAASSGGRTGGTATTPARRRSPHTNRRRAGAVRAACRNASRAISAPCTDAEARSSEDPSAARCSSITASPLRHACRTRRTSPSASARRASARHAIARDKAGPRLRAAATLRSATTAVSPSPTPVAICPTSSHACRCSGDPSSTSSSAQRIALRRSGRVGRSAANRARSPTSTACACHHRRCWRVKRRSHVPRADAHPRSAPPPRRSSPPRGAARRRGPTARSTPAADSASRRSPPRHPAAARRPAAPRTGRDRARAGRRRASGRGPPRSRRV